MSKKTSRKSSVEMTAKDEMVSTPVVKKVVKRTSAEQKAIDEKMAKLREKKGQKEYSFARENAAWAMKDEILRQFAKGTSVSDMEKTMELTRHGIVYVLVRTGHGKQKGNPLFSEVFKKQGVVPEKFVQPKKK